MTVFYDFDKVSSSEWNILMFSYSEAVEVQRIVEAAATPYDAEGANLSELFRTIRGLSMSR